MILKNIHTELKALYFVSFLNKQKTMSARKNFITKAPVEPRSLTYVFNIFKLSEAKIK